MTTAYNDPQNVHNPSTGGVPPATWGDTVRDDLQTLANPPGCVLTSNDQISAAASGAWYNLSWANELRDTDNYHAGTGDTIVIPATLGGWYHLSGSIVFNYASGDTGVRMVRYTVDGAGDNRMAVLPDLAAAPLTLRVPFAQDAFFAGNAVVRISARQDSGGSTTLLGGSIVCLRLVALA